MHRLFVVGASRSGTTVVQRSLVDRFELASLPETNFFGQTTGGWLGTLLCTVGISRGRRKTSKALRQLWELLDLDSRTSAGLAYSRSYRRVAETFAASMDEFARQHDAAGWIEKTPKHYRKWAVIGRFVDHARFVHVLRWGPDVVASIRDRALRFPDAYGHQRPIRKGIVMWNHAARVAEKLSTKPEHQVVLYERFAANPELVLGELGQAFGLPGHPGRAQRKGQAIVLDAEGWKSGIDKEIEPARSKFDELFTPDEKRKLLRRLSLDRYRRLAGGWDPWQ